jgi:hypothetical protein
MLPPAAPDDEVPPSSLRKRPRDSGDSLWTLFTPPATDGCEVLLEQSSAPPDLPAAREIRRRSPPTRDDLVDLASTRRALQQQRLVLQAHYRQEMQRYRTLRQTLLRRSTFRDDSHPLLGRVAPPQEAPPRRRKYGQVQPQFRSDAAT